MLVLEQVLYQVLETFPLSVLLSLTSVSLNELNETSFKRVGSIRKSQFKKGLAFVFVIISLHADKS